MTTDILPHNDLAQNEAIIQKGLNTFYEVGNALTEIRDNKQYKENYSTFEDYCLERWDIKRRQAYKFIEASQVVSNLQNVPNLAQNEMPNNAGQVTEIAKAPQEEQAEVWETAQEETGSEQPTAKEIKLVVESRKEDGRFHISSGNNDWYTPSGYIESARLVLGGIYLDPASSELAQETVKATIYYTKETDGLSKKWSGTVWMNPPYSMPEIQLFIDKLLSEDVGDWIVLTNNSSDTGWFHKLLEAADYVCLTKGRVSFEYKDDVMATRQGQSFFYKGNSENGFIEVFKKYGAIMEVVHVHAS